MNENKKPNAPAIAGAFLAVVLVLCIAALVIAGTIQVIVRILG